MTALFLLINKLSDFYQLIIKRLSTFDKSLYSPALIFVNFAVGTIVSKVADIAGYIATIECIAHFFHGHIRAAVVSEHPEHVAYHLAVDVAKTMGLGRRLLELAAEMLVVGDSVPKVLPLPLVVF